MISQEYIRNKNSMFFLSALTVLLLYTFPESADASAGLHICGSTSEYRCKSDASNGDADKYSEVSVSSLDMSLDAKYHPIRPDSWFYVRDKNTDAMVSVGLDYAGGSEDNSPVYEYNCHPTDREPVRPCVHLQVQPLAAYPRNREYNVSATVSTYELVAQGKNGQGSLSLSVGFSDEALSPTIRRESYSGDKVGGYRVRDLQLTGMRTASPVSQTVNLKHRLPFISTGTATRDETVYFGTPDRSSLVLTMKLNNNHNYGETVYTFDGPVMDITANFSDDYDSVLATYTSRLRIKGSISIPSRCYIKSDLNGTLGTGSLYAGDDSKLWEGTIPFNTQCEGIRANITQYITVTPDVEVQDNRYAVVAKNSVGEKTLALVMSNPGDSTNKGISCDSNNINDMFSVEQKLREFDTRSLYNVDAVEKQDSIRVALCKYGIISEAVNKTVTLKITSRWASQ